MLTKLAAAHAAGKLQFFGAQTHLADAKAFAAFLASLRKTHCAHRRNALSLSLIQTRSPDPAPTITSPSRFDDFSSPRCCDQIAIARGAVPTSTCPRVPSLDAFGTPKPAAERRLSTLSGPPASGAIAPIFTGDMCQPVRVESARRGHRLLRAGRFLRTTHDGKQMIYEPGYKRVIYILWAYHQTGCR